MQNALEVKRMQMDIQWQIKRNCDALHSNVKENLPKFHFLKVNTNLKSGAQKAAIQLAMAAVIEASNRWFKAVFGGYSRGTLRLNKNETVYVFVGEEGHRSNSSDDSSTSGSFPGGGGTRTGHHLRYTTVSGTGGGSTSIRIGGDTN